MWQLHRHWGLGQARPGRAGPPWLGFSRPAASLPLPAHHSFLPPFPFLPLSLLPGSVWLLLLSSRSPSFWVLLPPSWSSSLPLSVSGPLCLPPPYHLCPFCLLPQTTALTAGPHCSQALCCCLCGASVPPCPPPGRPAVLGRPRWRVSLGAAVQLLPGKGQLAGPGRREVPSWGVPPALAGPSRLGEYRGDRLWSEPSVHALRHEAGTRAGEAPAQIAGPSLQKPLALMFPLPQLETWGTLTCCVTSGKPFAFSGPQLPFWTLPGGESSDRVGIAEGSCSV